MTTIFEALKQIDWQKAEYFRYKFPDLRYYQERPLKTEKEFLHSVNRKSMNPFLKWEKTDEYKSLLMLYLSTKISDDFMDIYNITIDNAKKGDEKAIKIFLQLQREIQQNAKAAGKLFEKVEIEEEETENDLDLDLS
ncbi:hypothetical protein LIZ76_15815 [Caldibacillus sp. 210928-DFI.2.22]|uniref:hypothetical protein n=1 Tax=unclassified Caldibacillus TaxID=2641266 RepID=UPI001D08DB1F|nr:MULTISPECIES: hypothetical protein [unclassified Caldibacillus]MCB7071392.1 hypothetical protein [Caldibacillus sp. 210928-DFI.2.22]MCB7073732.1 hypothetical protein [Caldibacillus sp. 210928-DFI.2.18]